MDILAKLVEHDNWANLQLIRACSAFGDAELDAKPQADGQWSIRQALTHPVECQQGYRSLLTLPPEARGEPSLSYAELEGASHSGGKALSALALDRSGETWPAPSDVRLD